LEGWIIDHRCDCCEKEWSLTEKDGITYNGSYILTCPSCLFLKGNDGNPDKISGVIKSINETDQDLILDGNDPDVPFQLWLGLLGFQNEYEIEITVRLKKIPEHLKEI
jgi:hypothetical protein